MAECCTYVAKYAGIVLTELHAPEQILPLLTLRMNLYTDPRKPIQVEAKLNAVGAVTAQSPLLITTNFSLTYYTVEGEVEASRVPALHRGDRHRRDFRPDRLRVGQAHRRKGRRLPEVGRR